MENENATWGMLLPVFGVRGWKDLYKITCPVCQGRMTSAFDGVAVKDVLSLREAAKMHGNDILKLFHCPKCGDLPDKSISISGAPTVEISGTWDTIDNLTCPKCGKKVQNSFSARDKRVWTPAQLFSGIKFQFLKRIYCECGWRASDGVDDWNMALQEYRRMMEE